MGLSDEQLSTARRLLQQPDPTDLAVRLRRARQLLVQSGAAAEAIERLGLESAALALGRACSGAGLALAAERCRDLAGPWAPLAVSNDGPAGLDALNAWVFPRSLRRYQLLVLEGRPFRVEVNGTTGVVQGCTADGDRNHLLLEQSRDGSLWWWSSHECADGYRLEAGPLQPAPAAALPSSQGRWGQPPLVRSGNSNFAHFLWNELDPLLRLGAENRRLDVVQDHNTVLDLGTLAGITLQPAALLAARASVRLGSTLVSDRARRAVLQGLETQVSLTPLPSSRAQPLLLLGVRGPGRRELRNEVPFMIGLIDAISRHFHNPLILLDGFTYQHNNRHHSEAQQRAQACSDRIAAIMQACPQAQLESLSGLAFAPWLQRSAGVRFYVTHEGTMQHKVGWLRPDIPGLCLVGSEHALAIAAWHRHQCEGASSLATLPVELVQQDPRPADQPASEDRNQPFSITDIEQAIQASMQRITACLELERQQPAD